MRNGQFHQTVVQEESVTGLYNVRQVFEAHRYAMQIARDRISGECELLARLQVNRFWFDVADPHLWPRKVGHDGHAAADGLCRQADALDALGVTGEIAVREVQPRDIQARADETSQHFL